MTAEKDPIVAHKTSRDGPMGFRHEPLRASEAEAAHGIGEPAQKDPK